MFSVLFVGYKHHIDNYLIENQELDRGGRVQLDSACNISTTKSNIGNITVKMGEGMGGPNTTHN